jgi:hypothetical protein
MKQVFTLVAAGIIAAAGLAPVTLSAADSPQMRTGKASGMARTPALSESRGQHFVPVAPAGGTKEVPNFLVPERLQDMKPVETTRGPSQQSPIVGQAPAADLSFGGYDNTDNVALLGFQIMPPDTEGDVGMQHYVQWNNLGFKIFDKAGNLLNGPNGDPGNLPWVGSGLGCEFDNDGDPIVLYDHVAGRWLFSQFDIGPGMQCVAITDGEDPAGPYTAYEFPISLAGFNDYPKLGIWTSADGSQSSYHVTTNEFNGGFLGVNLTALDRDAILAGAAAPGFVQFTLPPVVVGRFAFSLQPGHLEGPVLPAAGTCETYIQAFDDETWGDATGPDGYRTWEFCVDHAVPANSTLTEHPFIVSGNEFDAELCGFSRNCIPQPGVADGLDTLGQFTMYRFAVRDVNGTLTGAISHSVDLGGNLAGVQWAQFDMSGANPTLADVGQLDVGDGDNRWMPSVALDQSGNMALTYTVSSAVTFPSMYFTGREASDPAGTLQAESVCIDGTGSQTGPNRWGDYATVSVDPEDDCTFWMTNEYVETTGSFEWDTQVCTFKFENCGDNTIEAIIDIKFCSNPNGFNCKKKGVTPVTIFGTADLDVADIDISSLQLCLADDTDVCTGAPKSWSVADRGDPTTDQGAAQCAINPDTGEEEDFLNQDGLDDLDAGFDTRELAGLEGFGCPLARNEASATVVVKGMTTGGTPFISTPIGDPGIDQLANKGKGK